MLTKTEQVEQLLTQGKTIDEVVQEVKCSRALVHGARKKLFPDKVRAYKKKPKKKVKKNKPIKFFKPATDNVNSPAHYTAGGIETYDFIRAKGLSYELGNVVKYITRADHKGNRLEDLKKAQWYLNAAINNAAIKAAGGK